MADKGVDPETVISNIKGQPTQMAALKGARKMSITALLRPECRGELTALCDLVGAVGPAQVFWEERSWYNKRNMPRYRNEYRSRSKIWQEVLRVTAQSFERFVQAL